MDYQTYLRSEHWRLLRGAKLQISPRCEECKEKTELEVHHRFYRPDWHDSKLTDLKTLCHGCHISEHAKDWERLPKHLRPLPAPKHVLAKPVLVIRAAQVPQPRVETKNERLERLARERKARMSWMRQWA